MKRLATFFLLTHSLFAAETIKEVRFDVLIVRLPEASAAAISQDLRDPAKVAVVQEKLIAGLGKDVELVDWPTVTTPSGQQAVVENIDEIRYPSEFEPPTILLEVPEEPADVPNPSAPDAGDAAPKLVDGKPAETKADKKKHTVRVEGDLKLVGGVATSFEVKNAGISFQVEPTIAADGKRLRFMFSLQHVMFLGTEKSVMEVSPTHKISVEVARFHTVKSTTTVAATSGQPVLLSFNKLREPKDKVEIAICTATIVDTGIAAPDSNEPK